MEHSGENEVSENNCMKEELGRSDSIDMFPSQDESQFYGLQMTPDDVKQPKIDQQIKHDFGFQGDEDSDEDSFEETPKDKSVTKRAEADLEGSLLLSSGKSQSGGGDNVDKIVPKELSVDEVLEQLKEKRYKRKELMTEIKKADEKIESMNRSGRLRKVRMEVQANIIKRQEGELFRQSQEVQKDSTEKGGVPNMKVIKEDIKMIVKDMDELEKNVERLVNGKYQKGDGPNVDELKIIHEKWDSVNIFCPGSIEDQPEEIRKEILKMKNMKIIYCLDEGIKKIVSEMKNIEAEEDTEGKLGICILKCGKGGPEDDEFVNKGAKKFMAQLQIMVNRGREKFNDLVLVIPPATEKNWKITMKVEKEVQDTMKDQKIINLLKEQIESGKKDEGDSEKVWEREGNVFSRKYGEEEEGGMLMNSYVFRRCLAKVAGIDEKEDKVGCLECGFHHQETLCPLNAKT